MREKIDRLRGRVRGHRVFANKVLTGLPPTWTPVTRWSHNDVMYDWGTIVGNLLLKQGLNYGIGGFYIEYENVVDPDDAVAIPEINREEGVSYYDDLTLSGTKDFLRVPLIAGVLNSSDATNFPGGNQPTFFAQTSGVVGVNGKPFSDASNSKVYGGALISIVDENDRTKDLVFSRFYFAVDEQMLKQAAGQVGLEWELTLD